MSHQHLEKRHLTFSEIAELQDILNSKADPKNSAWRAIRTKEDFILAASLEMAELLESAPWKWWKKGGDIDWWNLKIEAIDILHFLASSILLEGMPERATTYKLGFEANEDSSATLIDEKGFIKRTYALELIRKVSTVTDQVEVVDEVMKAAGLQAAEISAIYLAKYTLNELRWAGGYGDGTYEKFKAGGVEDNVFLKAVVDKFLADKSINLGQLSDLVRETMTELV